LVIITGKVDELWLILGDVFSGKPKAKESFDVLYREWKEVLSPSQSAALEAELAKLKQRTPPKR
jgi:hypothetical protein